MQNFQLVFQLVTALVFSWFAVADIRGGLRLRVRGLVVMGVACGVAVLTLLVGILTPYDMLFGWLAFPLILITLLFHGEDTRAVLEVEGITPWALLRFRV